MCLRRPEGGLQRQSALICGVAFLPDWVFHGARQDGPSNQPPPALLPPAAPYSPLFDTRLATAENTAGWLASAISETKSNLRREYLAAR